MIIAVYLIVKAVINMVIGGGFSLMGIILPVAMALVLFKGIRFTNLIVALIVAWGVMTNIKYNITHLPSTLIYIIEAVIDILAVLSLVTNNKVRQHFENKLTKE